VVASVPTPTASPARAADRGRARLPDETGWIERDGVRVAWERYGTGEPTVLLLPTWSIIPARHWKLQVPSLSRRFRVLTFDGRGSGRSDRPIGPAAYADTEFVADALGVLDAAGAERAVVAGLSMGAGYALRLAAEHPGRVLGAVLIGTALPFLPEEPAPSDGDRRDPFEDEPASDVGWDLYNAHHWRRSWRRFAEFFAGRIFTEPHSTKAREDVVDWMLDADPERIIDTERAPSFAGGERPLPGEGRAMPFARRVRCPCLVIHGTEDGIIGFRHISPLAEALGARVVAVEGGGHGLQGRQPVLVNRLIAGFAASLGGPR
jgi:pimeloyl-ACP methyl ester carboxylesterase